MTWIHLRASAILTQLLFSSLTMKALPANFCFLLLRSSIGEQVLLPIPGGYLHKTLMQKDNGVVLYERQRANRKKKNALKIIHSPSSNLKRLAWRQVLFYFGVFFSLVLPLCNVSILFRFGPFSTTLSILFGLQDIEAKAWRLIHSGFQEEARPEAITGRGNWMTGSWGQMKRPKIVQINNCGREGWRQVHTPNVNLVTLLNGWFPQIYC